MSIQLRSIEKPRNYLALIYYETLSVAGVSVNAFVLGAEMGLGGGAMVDVSYGDAGGGGNAAYTRVAYIKKASKKVR